MAHYQDDVPTYLIEQEMLRRGRIRRPDSPRLNHVLPIRLSIHSCGWPPVMSQLDGQKRKINRPITALQKNLLHLVYMPSLPIVDAVPPFGTTISSVVKSRSRSNFNDRMWKRQRRLRWTILMYFVSFQLSVPTSCLGSP